MKQVREDNPRLKRIVADLTLDKAVLQEVLSRKILERSQFRLVVEHLCKSYRVSERQAYCVTRLPSGAYRYRTIIIPG